MHDLRVWIGITRSAAEEYDRAKPSEVWFVHDASDSAMQQWLPKRHRALQLVASSLFHPVSRRFQTADAAMRAKYEARGWSPAKISRAIQQVKSSERPPFFGLAPGVRDSLARMAQLKDPVFLYIGSCPAGPAPEQRILDAGTLLSDTHAVCAGPLFRVVAKSAG